MSKKMPSSASSLAKKSLGIKQKRPTKEIVKEATNKKIKTIKDGNTTATCNLMKHFAELLDLHELENLPQLPSNIKQFTATYEMYCFKHNGTEYCREIKKEGSGKTLNTITKHWSKDSSSPQKPITSQEFETMLENSKKPKQKLLK